MDGLAVASGLHDAGLVQEGLVLRQRRFTPWHSLVDVAYRHFDTREIANATQTLLVR